jgi:hypothetical protein
VILNTPVLFVKKHSPQNKKEENSMRVVTGFIGAVLILGSIPMSIAQSAVTI